MLNFRVGKTLFIFTLALIVIFLLVGCNRHEPSGSEVEKEKTFEDGLFMSGVIPLANGAAYLKTTDAVYYVNGANAQKLHGLPSRFILAEIVALSDGSALINVGITSGKGLYRLDGAEAEKVTEAPSADGEDQAGAAPFSDFYFVEASRLRRELKLMDDLYSEEQEPR